ncbi:uncharacterized protein LACBIDRAFT_298196 [Laccaria bicolor S238N-H82]|uniref:Predicted protein n=1 Tax=Laccaria bicolor (strain S238N-H82 / ATCC MYA-4686) TaxID=486041 RepID=B0DCF9_LACBS|nr:uncharacterized protein LACBIDRAFT_298196 [Laccaria bicolor S238N-H82]EDR07890.1 predicted protein [Laccaria bicolor S238N-H82]|eukprot:XP_001881679.1 predicted protein [Laccaria bicolor S238N-H82]
MFSIPFLEANPCQRRSFPRPRLLFLLRYSGPIPPTPHIWFVASSPARWSLLIVVVVQCETLHLTWSRGASLGYDYFSISEYPELSSYPSEYIKTPSHRSLLPTNLLIDWQVPFPPGTQYQICMIDVFGVSGGCRSLYTVVPNTSISNSTCQNVTAPAALSVVSTTASGPISQYSSVNQCTDVVFTPKSGIPPFTLTVGSYFIAPSLHPPLNFTSKSMDPISWTVSLPEGFPFFASLRSSDGLMWANGPMHAGGSGPTDCLSPGAMSKKSMIAIAIGSSLGSAVIGVLLGIVICWLVHKRQLQQASRTLKFDPVIEGGTRVDSVRLGQDEIQTLRSMRIQRSSPSSPRVSSAPEEDQLQTPHPSRVQSSSTTSLGIPNELIIDPFLGAGGRPPRPLPTAPTTFPPEKRWRRKMSISTQASLPSSSASAVLSTRSPTYVGPYLDHLPESDLPPEYMRNPDEALP